MKFNNKKRLSAAFMTAILAGSVIATSTVVANANTASGSPEEQADITNWIANTPQQVSNNMAMQHIDTNNLNGVRYIIQWGDTLWSISNATGISIPKLCYDNNIQNANLIYAGDVLILNRDGDVPAGYNPNVNPYAVAQTKVTINNGPAVVNINVQPKSVEKYYNNTDKSDNSTNLYKAANDSSSANSTTDDSDSDNEQSSSTKTSHKHHSSSVSASDIVDGLEDANSDDKLSFEEGDGGDDADELDVDSAAILKDAKKGNYDDILDEIKDALDDDKDDDDVTIYIEKDGKNVKVYASYSDDDDSSSEDSNDDDRDSSQSSSDDEDSNSQATTNDEDTDTTDDDE